jgi:cellulose synthase operon protein C
MLGMSMFNAGKYRNAVSELEDAVKRDPSQVQAGSALMAIYMQSGQAARAVKVGDGLLKHQPTQPGLHNMLGMARARSGDLAGARASFEQAIKLDANFIAPQVQLARLESNAKLYAAALLRLHQVLSKDAKHVDALVELARVHQHMGKLADAQRTLEKADDLSGADNLAPAVALVDFHLANRRPDHAVEASRRLVNKAPEAIAVLVTVARAHLAAGDVATARTKLTRAASLADYDPTLLVEIALLQQRGGHLAGAASSLEKALSERPDFMPALALLADVERRQGALDKAEAHAKRMTVLQPKQGIGHALLGDVASERKQLSAATEAYRRAHALDQTSDSLIRLHSALSRTDASAATLLADQWLKARPRDHFVRRALADTQARAGNYAAARMGYEEVAKAAPDNADVLNNLANLQILTNDPRALATAERALAKSPNAANVLGTTGWAAFKAGQAARALQLLRDARLRDPTNLETRYFLGAVLASAGRASEAREELQAALRGGQAFPGAKDAEKLLAKLL